MYQSPDCLTLFSNQNLRSVLMHGVGHWRAFAEAADQVKWIALCANRNRGFPDETIPHGVGHLLFKCTGWSQSPTHEDRKVFEVSAYTPIYCRDLWDSNSQNPVRYNHRRVLEEKLGSFDRMVWLPIPPR